MMKKEENLNLEIRLSSLETKLDKINRKQEAQAKQLDNIDADRQLFENIIARLAAVEEQLKLSRQNDNNVKKDLSYDIALTGDRVEASVKTEVEEIKTEMEKITNMVEKKKVIPKERRGFFARFRWG